MNRLAELARDQGLALNQRAARAAANGVDWLFKRDTLIKSGRTWYELVHDSDLMAVRYYELPEEDEIEIRGGQRVTVQKKVFPGYVLVEMILDPESWFVVRNTPGVTSFVGGGNIPGSRNEPVPLEEHEVIGCHRMPLSRAVDMVAGRLAVSSENGRLSRSTRPSGVTAATVK